MKPSVSEAMVKNINFAEKLKTLRKEMSMSQEKLAEKLGVSRQAITKWETDAGIHEGTDFTVVTKGVGTSISYEKNGERIEAFDHAGASNIIELNGLKSKLIINQIAF